MSSSEARRRNGVGRDVRVLVLRGGPSAEREVSLLGGAAVAAACRRLGYSVVEADIGPDQLSALDMPADVVFPVLHGRFGEDGGLQAILERRNLCYVGSGSAASSRAMNKDAAKRAWRAAGLPTADWVRVDLSCGDVAVPRELSPPYVLKPTTEGSSIGVRMCNSLVQLHEAVRELATQHGSAIVERRLFGPELTVGILGEAPLPVIQVKPAAGFYDYQAKYQRNDTAYLLEPEVERATCRTVEQMALEAFRVLGCRDFARADFIVDEHLGPQILEINTIPGLTDHSLLPKAAAAAGIGFDELVARLLAIALRRDARL